MYMISRMILDLDSGCIKNKLQIKGSLDREWVCIVKYLTPIYRKKTD